jgi:hypothetical protein
MVVVPHSEVAPPPLHRLWIKEVAAIERRWIVS